MSSSSISHRLACWVVLALLMGVVRTAVGQSAIDTAEVAVSGPDGATLFVDGQRLGALPLPDTAILPAGPHRFQLLVGNHKAESDALLLPANRLAELHLSLHGRDLAAVLHITPSLLLILEPAGLPQLLTDAITQAVAAAARQEHALLLRRDRQTVIGRQRKVLSRCLAGDDCHEPLFENGEVSFVVALKLESEGGPTPSYAIHAALLDVRTKDNSLRAEERCADCGVETLAQQVGKVVSRMLNETVKRPRGTLAVASTPAGAQVFVDGRWLGLTPYKQEAFAGQRTIEIEQAGYRAERQILTVEAGQISTAQVALFRLPTVSSAARSRPLGRLITGSALIGGGLLLGGFGISALVMHGQCLDGSDRGDFCTPVLNTRAVGSALLGSGAVLALTGTLLLAIPERKRAPASQVIETPKASIASR